MGAVLSGLIAFLALGAGALLRVKDGGARLKSEAGTTQRTADVPADARWPESPARRYNP